MPHSETFQPFRAAEASALGTGLRGPSFVGFDIHRLPSGSLVPQHVPERGPARVQNGLRHSGFRKLRRVHISDDDQSIGVRQPFAGDVKVMFSRIGDLRLNGAGDLLPTGALGFPECAFVLPVVPQRRDFGSVAASGERFEPEVYTDLAIANRKIVGNLALEADIPASARVLNERAGTEDAFDAAMLPETETALEVDCGVPVDLNGARDKGYPAECALGPEAGTKARASAVKVARCGKLAADGLHGIAMQAEFGGASGAELDKVKGRRPSDIHAAFAPPFGFALRGDAEIPDLIACDSMASEMLAGDGILDSEFERENAHFGSVLLPSGPIKSASLDCRPVTRSRFVSPHNINSKRRAFLPGLNAGVSGASFL